METVKNKMEKYRSYKTQIAKYNKAIEQGFFYEAMIISYAIMEDRMLSFLNSIGFVNIEIIKETTDFSVSKAVLPFIRSLTGQKKVNVKNISAKRDLIKSILTMTYEEAEQYEKEYAVKQRTEKMNGYLQDLFMDIDESGIDRKEALEMLEKQKQWCDRRNSIIHGLLNLQTGESFNNEVEDLARDSMVIWRYLDNMLAAKLHSCKLREKYNIK